MLNQDQCERIYRFSIVIPITLIETEKGTRLRIYTVTVSYLHEITIFRPIALIKDIHYELTYGNIIAQSFFGDFSEFLK